MYRIILLLILALATAVWAQDSAEEDVTATVPETETEFEVESIVELSEEEFEDLGIDGQDDHTEEDEDVFKPTDAVSYQQSIDFPVDI